MLQRGKMDDIDKEITFLREKIAEMRERSDMKTPVHERRALIRGFEGNTMRKDEEYLCDHHSANETYANPRSNEMFPDYFELYSAPNRKTSHLPDEYNTWSLHRADAFWKSRERFTSPEISSTLEDAYEAQNSITPATYDGSGQWIDYHAHFEACSEINGWSYATKGLYLAASLRGSAQGCLGNIPKGEKPDYETLVLALEDRFAPPSQAELYRVQMRERRQRAGETFSELGQAIQRLANMAYPTATFEFRDMLARDHFVDALDNSEVRIRIQQSRPRSLNDAVKLAVELEAHRRAERKCYARHLNVEPSSDKLVELVKALSAKIESLQTDLRDLQLQRSKDNAQDTASSSKRRLCYFCRKPGHLRRDCVVRKQSKSKQLRRRRRSRAENQTCKSDSSYSGKNAGQQDEPQNGDVAQHRLAEDCSNGCYRVGIVKSVPNSNERKMVKDQVRCEKIVANSSSVTVGRTLQSAKGKEKDPEWKLARRCKNGRRRKGMERGSPGIRCRRGKKSSSEQLRPHGVVADGSRLQASDNMPGEVTMLGIPDLRESQMFHKRWKTSSARRKVEV